MVAEAAAEAPAAGGAEGVELAAVEPAATAAYAPVPEATSTPVPARQASFAEVFVTPQAPVSTSSDRVVLRPVVQPTSAAPRENASQAPQPVSRIAQNSPQRRIDRKSTRLNSSH